MSDQLALAKCEIRQNVDGYSNDQILSTLLSYPSKEIKLAMTRPQIVQIDRKSPFLLLICQIESAFSWRELRKRSDQFPHLQRNLLQLSNQYVLRQVTQTTSNKSTNINFSINNHPNIKNKNNHHIDTVVRVTRLEDELPKLPLTPFLIKHDHVYYVKRAKELQKYAMALFELVLETIKVIKNGAANKKQLLIKPQNCNISKTENDVTEVEVFDCPTHSCLEDDEYQEETYSQDVFEPSPDMEETKSNHSNKQRSSKSSSSHLSQINNQNRVSNARNSQREIPETTKPVQKDPKPIKEEPLLQVTSQNLKWISFIAQFFELTHLIEQEIAQARRIEGFLHKCLRFKMKEKFQKLFFQMKGYQDNVQMLPLSVKTCIFGYLQKKELLKLRQVSKRFAQTSMQPYLWRSIQIYAQKDLGVAQNFQRNRVLAMLISRSNQLRILSLKYCPSVDEQATELIAMHANPFALQELYLDGCERINDAALLKLTKPRRDPYEHPMVVSSFIRQQYSSNPFEHKKTMIHVASSGTRGLRVISLAECRVITDQGISQLRQCQFLEKICLLGCANVKDEGVMGLARTMPNLNHLDLGSTQITNASIQELVKSCLNLRVVNLMGCKKLNVSDDLLLRKNKINVESGEDVFRFNLIPEYNSDLPRITSSVLKTRSTLSLHKVYKYLLKKLQEIGHDMYEANNKNNNGTVSELDLVMITCNRMELDTSLQLREVHQLHWPFEDRLLTLYYKRRDKTKQTKQILLNKPLRPPEWVPSHLALNCVDCDNEFKFLVQPVKHCRNCGQCFCSKCAPYKIPLPQYGYQDAVRVCKECFDKLLNNY